LEHPIKNRRENNSTSMLPAFRLFFIIRALLTLISAAKSGGLTFQQKRRPIRDGLTVSFKDRGNQLF
jgi:hypothetical protein